MKCSCCGRTFTTNPSHNVIFCVCGMMWRRWMGQRPGRKSHHATSARAPVQVTFCKDDGCMYAKGHDGPHDITWQAEHDPAQFDGDGCAT